ncbi:MAG: DUF2064 domain-containing protein [Pseudomonadota bacterium]
MANHNQSPLLVLVCKRPSLGVGKQRIATVFGKAKTVELAKRLLACAFEDLVAWPFATAISVASDKDVQWAQTKVPTAQVLPQSDGNLGERLSDACQRLRVDDQPIMLIGADAPELTLQYLQDCLLAFERADVVLGQAHDGGVVVMGAKTPWPPLHALPWSTAELGSALHAQCSAYGLKVATLPPIADIDRFDQLDGLAQRISNDPRPARQALCHWITDNISVAADTYSATV